jgi:hypothetical protein
MKRLVDDVDLPVWEYDDFAGAAFATPDPEGHPHEI